MVNPGVGVMLQETRPKRYYLYICQMRGILYHRDRSGYLTVGSEYLNKQIRSITWIMNNLEGITSIKDSPVLVCWAGNGK